MAELDGSASAPHITQAPAWTSAQSRAQLAAVAWLRWRIFVNNFRRNNKKRSVAGLIVIILLRIVVWAIIAGFLVGPVAGCGYAAYARPDRVGTILWAIFSVHFFISLNVVPGTVGFDLTPLMRFPIRFRDYLLIRLFFGLVAIPTIVANLCIAAVAVGIGLARHELFPWAALVTATYALTNVFFLRMVFAWIDRWMATRRAREILGGVVLLVSLSFQFFAMQARQMHRQMPALLDRLGALHPVTKYLPPSLAGDAILDWAHSGRGAAYARLFGLVCFAGIFLAIFAMRLKREFRGENLSEAGKRASRSGGRRDSESRPIRAARSEAELAGSVPVAGVPSTIVACLQKEMIYLKRSGAQLYGLITPIFFVFIFSHGNRGLGGSTMLLPYVVSYVMFGLMTGLYNVLGADGAGFSLYLLAPVRLRDVLIAKNLLNSSVIAIEILLAVLAVRLLKGTLPSAAMTIATLLWAGFALLVNLAVGNLRSVLAPMRFELGKTRRAPAAKGSGLISMGVLFGTLGMGAPIIYACRYFGYPWLPTAIFVVLDCAALLAYLIVLERVDRMVADRRDGLVEALCKT